MKCNFPWPARGWLAMVLGFATAAADGASPIARGAKPADLGNIGAGEGPVWQTSGPGSGSLLFTGGGRITRRDATGAVSTFREDSGGANGLAFDSQGRLVVCESSRHRVTRTESDGRVTVLASNYQGSPFNSPNDLAIDSKGRVYFTDPRYGSRAGMALRDEKGELVEGVYRIDAPGVVTRVIGRELERPNGITVSPGDQYLYVADNNNNQVGGARKLWRFDLRSDGSVDLASRKLIFDWKDARGPDGLKLDQVGRLYVAAGLNKPNPPYETAEALRAGVYILSPQGRVLEFLPIPDDEVTNCAFGGPDFKTLFITAGGHLWSVRVDTPGR
ncbi:MAG TPA: SMP-30/gluconolactonase/LRE family protein [Candidatus Saccharimonadales bacterium]|nr:SMP-30/gluconolactonase/LRE family protein [Candidatus Saccharimonadales bacterium]